MFQLFLVWVHKNKKQRLTKNDQEKFRQETEFLYQMMVKKLQLRLSRQNDKNNKES